MSAANPWDTTQQYSQIGTNKSMFGGSPFENAFQQKYDDANTRIQNDQNQFTTGLESKERMHGQSLTAADTINQRNNTPGGQVALGNRYNPFNQKNNNSYNMQPNYLGSTNTPGSYGGYNRQGQMSGSGSFDSGGAYNPTGYNANDYKTWG